VLDRDPAAVRADEGVARDQHAARVTAPQAVLQAIVGDILERAVVAAEGGLDPVGDGAREIVAIDQVAVAPADGLLAALARTSVDEIATRGISKDPAISTAPASSGRNT